MTTLEATRRDAFPAVDAARELNLGVPEEFPVDPISSEVATVKELKEEAEARARAKAAAIAREAKKCCKESSSGGCPLRSGCPLTSVLIVSGVIAAAVGVAFIVAKKWKTK